MINLSETFTENTCIVVWNINNYRYFRPSSLEQLPNEQWPNCREFAMISMRIISFARSHIIFMACIFGFEFFTCGTSFD